jgi:hypothetical protein
MFKPIEVARAAGKFKSLDQLAQRLRADFSDLDWPAPRALAVKVGDIDRGDRIWWTKRDANAAALAALLEVPLVDLGLHDAPSRDMFEFATFPELPPIALAREVACEIGRVAGGSKRRSGEELAFWLAPSPPRHAWRGPEYRMSWLQFRPGSGHSFFWATLCARTRHDHVSTRRLVDASERLRQPGNLILRIEQPCEDVDMIALGRAHPDLNVLIVAPLGAPTSDEGTPTTWLPAWSVLTGAADERIAELKDPAETYDGIARYEWHLHEDWRDRLLEWVEKRIGRATNDTLFTASGVTKWLASFPPGWQFVEGPADLLAVCRLCHLSPDTALPRVSDVDAGWDLLKRVVGADIALSRRFTALVAARLEARDLDWRGPLTRTQWAALGPAPATVPDEATLLEIANATNIAARRQRARAVSEQIRDTGLAPLIQAGLLVATHTDALALTPQFLVDLVARDRLMQVIRDEPVERWAMYCLDTQRRPLVDAALGSMSAAELLVVLDRLRILPATNLASIAGAEALFREVGRRVGDGATVPTAFECLADMVLSRLATDGFTPQQWTGPNDDLEEHLEWTAICWAWSLWRTAPPVEMSPSWIWYFPGWVPELAAVETWHPWLPQLPDQSVLPYKWQRMTALATQLVQRLTQPPADPPDFLKPMLLIEALRGRWPVDSTWLNTVMGHRDAQPSAAVASLILRHLEQIGPPAAAKLLPALVEFVLLEPRDGIRSVIFYRSRIRTWVLQNISLTEVTSCLTEDQLEVLWQAPHTLPPHLLVGMLQNPDELAPARLSVRMEAVRVLGADHADTLSRLLATESLGAFAADRLWKVAPAAAARLLEASGNYAPASLRLLILSAPMERTGSVARVILSRDELLSESERIDWARQRLCAAGVHAEMLGRILDLDIDTRPWTTSSQRG